MTDNAQNRCRLVLVGPDGPDWQRSASLIAEAMTGGDIASLLLWQGALDETDFQKLCEATVPAAQEAGIAAVVAGDTRIAARAHADGVHLDQMSELGRAIEQNSAGKWIIGAGGVKTRDEALRAGELRPDYLFFGRFGYDTKPEPHPRNLSLGHWWAEFVEIPCIVMAGSVLGSVETVAATGAEFVAASSAIFTGTAGPAEAVSEANRLLDSAPPAPAGTTP